MSTTSAINAIHISFLAEDRIASDQADGTYAANIAGDSRYYMWQGEQQVIPIGMGGNPEGFAAGLKASLPGVNTLRLTFNAYSFNADGSLNPQYERFLAAAVAQGFQLIMNYADGEMQRLGNNDGLSVKDLYATLDGTVHDRMMASWSSMMTWMGNHSDVKKAVYGYELVNEAAAYEQAVDLTPRGEKAAVEQSFVELYAHHMADAAAVISAQDEARILVGGWAYSARFAELAENNVGAQSALDYLRSQIGDKLIWAAHIYPGWHTGASVGSVAELKAEFERVFAPLGSDDILLTETNLRGDLIDNHAIAPTIVTDFARAQEWFAAHGIGATWSPGAQAGASSLVSVDPDGGLRFLHQHSYAFAMNAFSLDDHPKGHLGNETITAQLIAGHIRAEAYEGGAISAIRAIGVGFGYDGNDQLLGRAEAHNYLYGGTGQDGLRGAGFQDFLFGQSGDDVLLGNAGKDLLFGGTGNDLLRGGDGNDSLEGGAGADRFDARSGSDIIVDFNGAEGDRIFLGARYDSFADITAHISYAAINGVAVDDVVITHANGTTTTILDARGSISAGDFLIGDSTSQIDGTIRADKVAVGFQDIDGTRFGGAMRIVSTGGGNDSIRGSIGADVLKAGADQDRVDAGLGNDLVYGGTGRDTLIGNTGNDHLHGGNGLDKLIGGLGQDHIYAGHGDDFVWGGAGRDSIAGGRGHNQLHGGDGADVVWSGRDFDRLWGDAGNDRLVADLSHSGHRLTGGAGADVFVFHGAKSGGHTASRITDFHAGQDRVVVDGDAISLRHLSGGMTGHNTADGFLLRLEPGHTVLFEDFLL